MRTMVKPQFSDAFVRLVAAFATADPRTVRRYLDGEDVKGTALRERLAAAKTKAEAMADPAPPEQPKPPAKARRRPR